MTADSTQRRCLLAAGKLIAKEGEDAEFAKTIAVRRQVPDCRPHFCGAEHFWHASRQFAGPCHRPQQRMLKATPGDARVV
jgi:hypothetical protein